MSQESDKISSHSHILGYYYVKKKTNSANFSRLQKARTERKSL